MPSKSKRQAKLLWAIAHGTARMETSHTKEEALAIVYEDFLNGIKDLPDRVMRQTGPSPEEYGDGDSAK